MLKVQKAHLERPATPRTPCHSSTDSESRIGVLLTADEALARLARTCGIPTERPISFVLSHGIAVSSAPTTPKRSTPRSGQGNSKRDGGRGGARDGNAGSNSSGGDGKKGDFGSGKK